MIPDSELTNRQPEIDAFASGLAQALQIPDTTALHTLAKNWAHWEYSEAANNPFDTEMPMPHATDYNSVGVKNYGTLQDGITATVETIRNGAYPNLELCLSQLGTNNVNTHWLSMLISSLNIWGTGNANVSFGWTQDMNNNQPKYIESFANPGLWDPNNSTPTPSPTPSPIIDSTLEARVTKLESDVAALNSAILAREHAQAIASDTFAHAMDVAADPEHIPPSP